MRILVLDALGLVDDDPVPFAIVVQKWQSIRLAGWPPIRVYPLSHIDALLAFELSRQGTESSENDIKTLKFLPGSASFGSMHDEGGKAMLSPRLQF